MNEPADKSLNFGCNGLTTYQVRKFLRQAIALQGFTAIRMRRPPLWIIPRRIAAIAQRLLRLKPSPEFGQTMRPHRQVERADIGPYVAQLLLTGSFDYFQVVMILFQRRAVGDLLQDGGGALSRVRTEIGQPVMVFLHDHDADTAPRRFVGGLKGLDLLAHLFAVLPARHLLPTALMSGAFAKTDALFAIDRWPARTTLGDGHRLGHGVQRGIA